MGKEKSLYLPGLNGIRAVAAMTVLFGHIFSPFGDWGLNSLSFYIPLPEEPVTTFFVISGFLITYLLMNEIGKTNNVNISKFYMRRILRIWPLYYVYMLLTIGVLVCLKFSIDESVWYYTLFSGNISFALGIGLIPLYHYWSLGVEEQYYLWYPWVAKIWGKHILTIVLVLCLLWFGMKIGSYVFLGKGFIYRILNITRFDCMLIGASGAILYYKKYNWFIKFCSNKWTCVISWILFFCSGFCATYIPAPIRAEFIALISLIVIMSGLVNKPILENRIMNYLGKISYGIYVIHPLLIFTGSYFTKKYELLVNCNGMHYFVFLFSVSLTIILAALSYKYLEMPFLRLKNRFAVIKSTNEKQYC